MADAGLRKVPQHDSVVAAHLDYEWVSIWQILIPNPFGKLLEVSGHARRSRREERIVFVEHPLTLNQFPELDHPAVFAEGYLQLKEILITKFFRSQKAIGDRHFTERHEGLDGTPTNQAVTHFKVSQRSLALEAMDGKECSVFHFRSGAILPG